MFPDLNFSDDEEETEDEEVDEIFYLWETNKDIFDVYKILMGYLKGEFYEIDSTILLALINDKYLSVSDSLDRITYIHSGYVSTLLTGRNSSNASSNRESP